MTQRKKLIEVALPLEAINVASAREKSIRHGHPSTLHLWWARRPLAACRAVIFTSLVDDPDDPNAPPEFVAACRKLRKGANALVEDTPRMRLFDFIELLVQWESTTDEDVLETARELILLSTDGNPPPLLDPFAGGGSIPLEAQRLGLEAHASDLNPVAVMINKALIEIPPRFANQPPVNPRDREKFGGGEGWRGAHGLAADVRYYGEWMRDRAWERIGHLYPPGPNGETVIAWLWARTVKCPNPACGAQMPLVSSFELSRKKGRKAWVEPQIDRRAKTVRFEVKTGNGTPPEPPKIGRGAKFQCLVCGEIAPDQHIYDEGIAGRMGAQLMAIVTEGDRQRNYHVPTLEHEKVAAQAEPARVPAGELPNNPRWFSPPMYGMKTFESLFTPRQLVALTTFSDLVSEVREQVYEDALTAGLPDDTVFLREGGSGAQAYAEAVSVYLGIAASKAADNNCTICTWMPGVKYEVVRNAFSRQAMPMTWDYAESNPFADSSGDYYQQVNRICNVIEISLPAINVLKGQAVQADARTIRKGNVTVISTDPPYYDNIGYADLSDFFYVWIRQTLRAVYPDIFGTLLVPKEPELVATPYRFDGSKQAAEDHFEHGLEQTFASIRQFVTADYPLTVYYAFKQQEMVEEGTASTGWETMLQALISSEFMIDGTWPMRTERTARTISYDTNALASSIVLVCRPRPDDAPQTSRREFVNALRRELPNALRAMQSGSIAPVDLAQASIGPGMAIYSRYSRVLEADGSPLTVRTALQLINQELDAFLAESEGDVDSDTRFCINWFEQFGFKEDEFGRADVLARAKNTSVDGLVNAGVLQAGAGKVRLYHWQEVDPGWTPQEDKRVTVWEAVTHLIERINTHGETGSAALLLRMNSDLAAEAKNLAYRLYQICDRKGWADLALDYNALVVSWPGLQERANELKQNQPPEQLGLF
jgi:putative DNA methylase